METLDRPALMRKTMPDLRHMMVRLGGYSPPSESRESLIHRLLMFMPQNHKPDVKIKHEPVAPVTEKDLRLTLAPLFERGLVLEIKDNCWYITIGTRKDSGSLAIPIHAIRRCAEYLMPPVGKVG